MTQSLYYSQEILQLLYGSRGGWYCGYVKFDKPPLPKTLGYNGIVTYIPVHGGVTYYDARKGGSVVYGFDGAHYKDKDNRDLLSEEWWETQCVHLAKGLKIASEYEYYFNSALDSKEKANIIDQFHASMREYGISFDITPPTV